MFLMMVFLPLNFLAATQDIAVDGWALTILSRYAHSILSRIILSQRHNESRYSLPEIDTLPSFSMHIFSLVLYKVVNNISFPGRTLGMRRRVMQWVRQPESSLETSSSLH